MKNFLTLLCFCFSFVLYSCSSSSYSDEEIKIYSDSIRSMSSEINLIDTSYSGNRFRRIELSDKIMNTKLKLSHNYILQASEDLNWAITAGLGGGVLSALITGIQLKNNDKVTAFAYVPALIGGIIAIVNYYTMASDLQKAANVIK